MTRRRVGSGGSAGARAPPEHLRNGLNHRMGGARTGGGFARRLTRPGTPPAREACGHRGRPGRWISARAARRRQRPRRRRRRNTRWAPRVGWLSIMTSCCCQRLGRTKIGSRPSAGRAVAGEPNSERAARAPARASGWPPEGAREVCAMVAASFRQRPSARGEASNPRLLPLSTRFEAPPRLTDADVSRAGVGP